MFWSILRRRATSGVTRGLHRGSGGRTVIAPIDDQNTTDGPYHPLVAAEGGRKRHPCATPCPTLGEPNVNSVMLISSAVQRFRCTAMAGVLDRMSRERSQPRC